MPVLRRFMFMLYYVTISRYATVEYAVLIPDFRPGRYGVLYVRIKAVRVFYHVYPCSV